MLPTLKLWKRSFVTLMMLNAIISALISRLDVCGQCGFSGRLGDTCPTPAALRIYSGYGAFRATFRWISHSRKAKNGNWLPERAILTGREYGGRTCILQLKGWTVSAKRRSHGESPAGLVFALLRSRCTWYLDSEGMDCYLRATAVINQQDGRYFQDLVLWRG